MVYCEGHRPIHKEGTGGLGEGGGGERILHFSTIFDDLMDDVHCSAYFYHFTLHSHEHTIRHLRTECWITSIVPISHCLTVAHKYRVMKPEFLLCASKRNKQTLQLSC